MNQYWSAIQPVLVTPTYQYWSRREVVLVTMPTSTDSFPSSLEVPLPPA